MHFLLQRVRLCAERVLGLQTLNPDMEQCVGANETESFTLAASVGVFVWAAEWMCGRDGKRRRALNA